MNGVSVIIAMKNAEFTIEKCILSMEKQSFQPLEILVCDDASTDNSVQAVKKIMKKYDNIRLFRNLKSRGAANARISNG